MSEYRVFPPDGGTYDKITVVLNIASEPPEIEINGSKDWQDAYTISATTARKLAAYLIELADRIESK